MSHVYEYIIYLTPKKKINIKVLFEGIYLRKHYKECFQELTGKICLAENIL